VLTWQSTPELKHRAATVANETSMGH
jgi:hypothetical protein